MSSASSRLNHALPLELVQMTAHRHGKSGSVPAGTGHGPRPRCIAWSRARAPRCGVCGSFVIDEVALLAGSLRPGLNRAAALVSFKAS